MSAQWMRSQPVMVFISALLLIIGSPSQLKADETNPALAALPEPGINSSVRGLVIKFKYDPSTPAEFVEAILSQVPPRQRISAAPQLQIIALDRFGDMLDIFFADYNHWVYINDANGQESRVDQYGRTGQFSLPFDNRIYKLIVRDFPLRKIVLEIETEPLFQQFCIKQLIDDPRLCNFELPELIFNSGFESD